MFAHVFEKYVDFVEKGNLLDHIFNRYFRTFEIDVFFEHVCKMLMIWLLNRYTCSRNTTNLLPGRAYFAHVVEKYDDLAVDPVGLAAWLAEWWLARARRRVLCTRVREIRQIRSKEARTVHTCSRNT